MIDLDSFITPNEYANKVNKSYFTIMRYIKEDRLDYIKIASRYLIPKDAKIKFKNKTNLEFFE